MIKECFYREQEFEIRFEWPLADEVMNGSPELYDFMQNAISIPGTVVIKENEKTVGLIFSYEGWDRLIGSYRFSGRNIQFAEEFVDFFEKVRPS